MAHVEEIEGLFYLAQYYRENGQRKQKILGELSPSLAYKIKNFQGTETGSELEYILELMEKAYPSPPKEPPKQKEPKLKRALPLRYRVFLRDGFKCRYCGRGSDETILEVDHILPKSKGGANVLGNYITSCRECNRGKGDVLLVASKGKRSLLIGEEGQLPSLLKFK